MATKTKKKPASTKKPATKSKPDKKSKNAVAGALRKKAIRKSVTPKKSVVSKTPTKKTKPSGKKTVGEFGLPEMLLDAAMKVLDERQADDIVTVDARGRSAMADYIVMATGRSARQLAAIADYLRAEFQKNGVRRIRVEGLPQGDWVLVDAGDIIVHLFRPEVRSYYALEDIWNKSRGG